MTVHAVPLPGGLTCTLISMHDRKQITDNSSLMPGKSVSFVKRLIGLNILFVRDYVTGLRLGPKAATGERFCETSFFVRTVPKTISPFAMMNFRNNINYSPIRVIG